MISMHQSVLKVKVVVMYGKNMDKHTKMFDCVGTGRLF
jgi:hypothetical protein